MLAALRRKNLHTWARGYARHLATPRPRVTNGPRHLLFAFCDHYEPLWGMSSGIDRAHGLARVLAWRDGYPKMTSGFRDADGKTPQHSFFFPGEQYDERYLSLLAELSASGHGEVELHLHHDGDTAPKLRGDLLSFLDLYARHGHLTRDADGRLRYAFIHGNWCLANARGDGRWCGVDEEIPLLFETGCYADYTFPSAPDECQPDVVNQLYWPTGDLSSKRAYERGERARVGRAYDDRLLMIEGPLALAKRPSRLSVRIESAAITAEDPATPSRIETWVEQGIHVAGRPEWIFVKVHTHGAPDAQAASLLGDAGRRMHETLTTRWNDGERYVLHYVTAREMFNIARAAMAGETGDPGHYRDYVLPPPPVARRGSLRGAVPASGLPRVGGRDPQATDALDLAAPRGDAVALARGAPRDAARRAPSSLAPRARERPVLSRALRRARPRTGGRPLALGSPASPAPDARRGASRGRSALVDVGAPSGDQEGDERIDRAADGAQVRSRLGALAQRGAHARLRMGGPLPRRALVSLLGERREARCIAGSSPREDRARSRLEARDVRGLFVTQRA